MSLAHVRNMNHTHILHKPATAFAVVTHWRKDSTRSAFGCDPTRLFGEKKHLSATCQIIMWECLKIGCSKSMSNLKFPKYIAELTKIKKNKKQHKYVDYGWEI